MSGPEKPDEKPSPTKGLTEEELAKLKAAQRRNMILAVIGGLILAVLGWFAGQNMRGDDNGMAMYSEAQVISEFYVADNLGANQ
ncbi:MAG: hypothetical protein GX483_06030 [Actinomycetaceae bacterium]|nr:hypothetical protein [Actinomycetaceae bacterium]